MSADSALIIDTTLSIPRSELTFRATRAGGPGGQHVNTSSTRVEVLWNVSESRVLNTQQRTRLRQKLSTRMDSTGTLRVVASAHRSQTRNREDAEERLRLIVAKALVLEKPRKKTRPSRAVKERRLVSKRLRSDKKRERRERDFD